MYYEIFINETHHVDFQVRLTNYISLKLQFSSVTNLSSVSWGRKLLWSDYISLAGNTEAELKSFKELAPRENF